MDQLRGQVAIVTGAAGGIGREICTRFLAEGASVAALDLNADGAAAAVSQAGPRSLSIACDVTDPDAMRDAVAKTASAFGKVTILCATAGGSTPADGPVGDATETEFWRAVRLDLFGTFLLCQQGLPELLRAGGGAVITMGSITAMIGVRNLSCYSAPKGGVVALTRSMAADYGDRNIRVNCIAPGITRTERVIKAQAEGRVAPDLAARHLGGLVDVATVAQTAVFLASPGAASITGQVLPVDGGASVT